MKIKTLLIAISCTIFLFTSCEKDEMGVGGTGGGTGKEDSMTSLSTRQLRVDEEKSPTNNDTKSLNTDLDDSDSSSYISDSNIK